MQQGGYQFRQSDPFTSTIINSPASPTGTMTTTSSSNTSSRFSFLNGQYNQLIDDLSIIDDMMVYQEDEETYDNTIADASRVVAKKQQSLDDLQQTEIDYVHSLSTFEEVFVSRMEVWFDQNQRSANKSIGDKLQDIHELIRVWSYLLKTHRSFCQSLKERKQMWGPTQLISDVLLDLHTNMVPLYEQFMKRIGKAIVALDQLYRASSFTKIVNVTIADHDMNYFLRLPLERMNVYLHTIDRLVENTLPGHPDYRGLKQAADLFRFKQFQGRLTDCKKHMLVMDIQRAMPNCPATVTLTRRVLLQAPLVKVSLDDPTNISDVRNYILYNDMLLFCKQSSSSSLSPNINMNKKLQLKGKLELRGAIVRPILPQLAEEMMDSKSGRKTNILNTFRNSKKDSMQQKLSIPTSVYGFEVLVIEGNADYIAAFHQNYGSSGPAVRRRHVLRAQSAEQQDAWLQSLDHAIQLVNTPTRIELSSNT
ncbi:hypothetical protein INT45_012173 [Circinella minor]|uniref:DH domain-containing protein n=1 Tax=Circinella minor TaxID=1195481 RepID=A0A8H7SAM6_9FUNG|nr:hypothetical protein INT45_012173 [Circinella minor]